MKLNGPSIENVVKHFSNKMSDISIVVVGDSQCGKTQLINQSADGCFSEVRKFY